MNSPGSPSPGNTDQGPPTPPCHRAVIVGHESDIPEPERTESVGARIKKRARKNAERASCGRMNRSRAAKRTTQQKRRCFAVLVGVDTCSIGSLLVYPSRLLGFWPSSHRLMLSVVSRRGSNMGATARLRAAAPRRLLFDITKSAERGCYLNCGGTPATLSFVRRTFVCSPGKTKFRDQH